MLCHGDEWDARALSCSPCCQFLPRVNTDELCTQGLCPVLDSDRGVAVHEVRWGDVTGDRQAEGRTGTSHGSSGSFPGSTSQPGMASKDGRGKDAQCLMPIHFLADFMFVVLAALRSLGCDASNLRPPVDWIRRSSPS